MKDKRCFFSKKGAFTMVVVA